MRTDTRRGMKGDWKNEQFSTVLFGDFYFSHDLCGHYVRENTSYDLCSCRRRRYDLLWSRYAGAGDYRIYRFQYTGTFDGDDDFDFCCEAIRFLSGTCVVGAEEIKRISAGAADFAFYRHGGGGGAH